MELSAVQRHCDRVPSTAVQRNTRDRSTSTAARHGRDTNVRPLRVRLANTSSLLGLRRTTHVSPRGFRSTTLTTAALGAGSPGAEAGLGVNWAALMEPKDAAAPASATSAAVSPMAIAPDVEVPQPPAAAVDGAANTVAQAAGPAAESVQDVDAVSDVADQVADSVSQVTTQITGSVSDAADTLTDSLSEASSQASAAYSQAAGSVSGAAADAVEKASMAKAQLVSGASGVAGSVTAQVDSFTSAITEAAGGLRSGVDGTTSRVVDTVQAQVEAVASATSEVRAAAGSAAAGVYGALPPELQDVLDEAAHNSDVALALGVVVAAPPLAAAVAAQLRKRPMVQIDPEALADRLQKNPSAFLVDTRSEEERASGGVPDLRGAARGKVAAVEVPALAGKVRGQVADPAQVELTIAAITVGKLIGRSAGQADSLVEAARDTLIRRAPEVYVMDADGRGLSSALAAACQDVLGVSQVGVVEGGFQAWEEEGLLVRASYNVSRAEALFTDTRDATSLALRSGQERASLALQSGREVTSLAVQSGKDTIGSKIDDVSDVVEEVRSDPARLAQLGGLAGAGAVAVWQYEYVLQTVALWGLGLTALTAGLTYFRSGPGPAPSAPASFTEAAEEEAEDSTIDVDAS